MLSVMYGLKGAGPGLCTVVPNVKNPPKVISRDFPSWKFLQILRTSVSGCLNYTFKICQTVAGTSTISQFHKFLNLVFGGFLQYDPTVRGRLRTGLDAQWFKDL